MEIGDIKTELDKLGGAGILSESAAAACLAAGELLMKFREIMITEKDVTKAHEQLKWMLVKNGGGLNVQSREWGGLDLHLFA